jgi:murein DD-endopeptidase MepM/ murein hydrolase activator NlpD
VSIRDSLGAFRSAFRDELAGVRAGVADQGGGSGIDRLDTLGRAGGTAETPRLGDYLAQGLAGWGGGQQASGLDRLGGLAGGQGAAYDPFGGFQRRQQYAGALGAQEQEAAARRQAQQVRAQGTLAAGDWSGPATADDNQSLTGEKIDSWMAQTRPGSPLIGQGRHILDRANQLGVSVPLFMGILLKESELGTTAGAGYNIAGVGGQGNFYAYGSWQQAIDGALANLATPTYKGKSAEEQIGNWFVGPQAWAQGGLNATDSTGGRNGTVGTYLNGPVAQAYGGLGVPFNQRAGGTPRAAGGTTVSPDGAVFPVAGWTQPVSLHWGSAEGTGATDIMAPAGSQIVAVRGGQVTYAAYDPSGGWAVMVQGDDGLQYYYAHMSQAPSVQAGQRIGAGTGLGLVGNTGNASTGPAHLHVGIGPQIRTGTGPLGGAGEYADGRPFDAVSYLNSILSGGRRTATSAASGPTTRPATTGRPIRY